MEKRGELTLGDYEITERGKIIIAVLIVLLVLVIPSVIISINAWVGNSSQDDTPGTVQATPQPEPALDPSETQPGEITRPQPPGGGQDPTGETDGETSEDENAIEIPGEEGNGAGSSADASDSSDSSDSSQESPPEQGLVGLNIAAGTMAFIFFPGLQDTLDYETAAAIVDFLASPRNTANSRIIVEIPLLTDSDRLNVVNAVTNELTRHGVSRNDIIFFTTGEAADEESFEVSLSYRQDPAVGK